MYDLRLRGAARTFFIIRRMAEMRVTIDLEREIVIIPDNFFKKIAEI